MRPILAGIDTGGTFTDLVAIVDGDVRVHKLRSTPDDPARAVLEGLRELLGDAAPARLTYSSTVALNALLERKGAKVALVTNAAFEDLIEIGRQNRARLYALTPSRTEPLVPAARRIGVAERTLFDGTILRAVTEAELSRVVRRAARSAAGAFAVCLLHSYANPRSEKRLARALARLGKPVSVSHRLLPEYREYERLSTTVVNAYVAPGMTGHLRTLAGRLPGTRLLVMQSSGTAIACERAAAEPVRTIYSGPAAGVIGARRLAATFGVDRFITFDMGGTSTDVSLFDRAIGLRSLSHPAGHPVRTPVIDIHTVGAGGGSIARVDAGGSLKVGPESAGADPGPACYGRGRRATVTDANLVAGRLLAETFLGGRLRLDPERAEEAVGSVARALRSDARTAALGILRVVNANMERAIRVITVERGFDPRDFALLAFGGAGPMHACELARSVGIRHVVLPRHPGLLCAYGALTAPVGRETSFTVRLTDPAFEDLLRYARPLVARLRRELIAGASPERSIREDLSADVRYRGQAYELEVPLGPGFRRHFHDAHRRLFGQAEEEAPIEVVNLRARVFAPQPALVFRPLSRRRRRPAPGRASVIVDGRPRRVPVHDRESLWPGERLRGPLLVTELTATAYVAPEFALRVDDSCNLHLEAR